MTARVIIVTPHLRPDGRKHPNAFDARLAGSDAVLCVSETPLLDSARVLLKAGKVSPGDMLEMWHAGSKHFLVRGKAGGLAELTIAETGFGPRLIKYQAYRGPSVRPRIGETSSGVPGQPPDGIAVRGSLP